MNVADPLHLLLAADAELNRFPANSRYHGIATRTWPGADGREIVFLARRFVPQPEQSETMLEHLLADGERLDHVAHHHLGDPELFWRICDANRALHPKELVEEAGRALRIPLPAGVPGGGDG